MRNSRIVYELQLLFLFQLHSDEEIEDRDDISVDVSKNLSFDLTFDLFIPFE